MRQELERRDRILAPVATRDAEGNVTGANLGALVRRLLLFEEVVIDSYGMRELPALVDALGPEQFIELLESRAVLIRADGWTFGEIGHAGVLRGRGRLPSLSFAFAPIVPAVEHREENISRSLGEIRGMGLDIKTSQKIRLAVVGRLTPIPENAGGATMDQLPTDLTQRLDIVRAATDRALREYGHRDPTGIEYDVRFEQEDEDVFRAETNIGERFGLDVDEVDRVLRRAGLAVGGLNERFEMMDAYAAVIGFREEEAQLLDAKLTSVLAELDPQRQEERLTRVLELTNLPDPETAAGSVNVERLLEVRQHEDVREFRQWLRTLDTATDAEIRDRVESVRERIAVAVHGPGGKAVRFAAKTAADLLPLGGTAADLALGVLDEFVLEKVLPEPGPVSFLGRTYRSIFEG